MFDDSLAYRIAFATYRNITAGTARRFSDLGITPEDFFNSDSRRLSAITGLRENFFDNKRRRQALDSGRYEADFVRDNNIKALFAGDDSYPVRLAECDDAPAMLFVIGRAEPRPAHVVSVVGTRHCTSYGVDFTSRLVQDLADTLDEIVIISGLAYGIDICAHRAAVKAGIPTGAVFAHGLSTVYPADHRDEARRIVNSGGFLATEYVSNAPIHKGNFLARNRIVAGLADVTVIVESDTHGGAMTTARIAGAYNRDVMAVPGRTCDRYSRGCNALLARREATIIRSADDLIDLTGWATRPKAGSQQELPLMTPQQTKIIEFITDNPTATVNELCIHIGLPVQHLKAILFEMEMSDMIVSIPGGRYAPVIHP